MDLAYGSLAAYVTDHALGVEGPIREYYVIGPHETTDENQWRTEIGWPLFHIGRTDTMVSSRPDVPRRHDVGAQDPGLEATALQAAGVKGWDGCTIIWRSS